MGLFFYAGTAEYPVDDLLEYSSKTVVCHKALAFVINIHEMICDLQRNLIWESRKRTEEFLFFLKHLYVVPASDNYGVSYLSDRLFFCWVK